MRQNKLKSFRRFGAILLMVSQFAWIVDDSASGLSFFVSSRWEQSVHRLQVGKLYYYRHPSDEAFIQVLVYPKRVVKREVSDPKGHSTYIWEKLSELIKKVTPQISKPVTKSNEYRHQKSFLEKPKSFSVQSYHLTGNYLEEEYAIEAIVSHDESYYFGFVFIADKRYLDKFKEDKELLFNSIQY